MLVCSTHSCFLFCNMAAYITKGLCDVEKIILISTGNLGWKLQYLERTSHKSGFHVSLLSWSNWNLEMLVFAEEGKRRTLRETLTARPAPTTNLYPHITPGRHRTGGALVTNFPTLLPRERDTKRAKKKKEKKIGYNWGTLRQFTNDEFKM